jgi:hypothetical protein
MAALVADWRRCLDERWVHPLIALAAFNLDFLCIHPFRDGNGRLPPAVAAPELPPRLRGRPLCEPGAAGGAEQGALLRDAGTKLPGLAQSKHDPWPYINYVLFIMKTAYREFAERVGEVKAPRGAKSELVAAALGRVTGEFTIGELERSCPGVSRDLIRRVLRQRQAEGTLVCEGRDPAARWRKKR